MILGAQRSSNRLKASSRFTLGMRSARFCAFECLQEDIHAPDMSSRKHTPGEAATRHHSLHERRRAAHRNLSAKARIRQMGSRQRRKPLPKLLVIHRGPHVESSPLLFVARSLHELSKAFPGRREDIEADASLLGGDASGGTFG